MINRVRKLHLTGLDCRLMVATDMGQLKKLVIEVQQVIKTL